MSTESFKNIVNDAMEKVYGNYEIKAIEVAGMLGTLLGAHDREIRDVSQQQYDRGYHDGQHSMDAEHRAVAMRLRHLPLDGGSHENLSQIARAVYHSDFGWTQGACAALRDELVRLMGGVSDDAAEPMTIDEFIECIEEDTRKLVSESNQQSDKNDDFCETGDADDTCDSQCRGACAAGDCGCAGKPKEVEHERPADDCGADTGCGGDDIHMAEESDGGTADDCPADFCGRTSCDVVHMDGLVSYDVLDNERHKAVCALRRWKPEKAINNDHCGEIQIRLLYQILDLGGAMMMDGADAAKKVRDRLIHLLGGDKPSGIDVLREMDAESDADGTCPNDDQILSITDELRRWANDGVRSYRWEEFKAIADRIDEQFARVCQQHETVLQETIADVVKEYEHDRLPEQLRVEKLERQRDEARDERDELMKQRAEMTAELARRLKERDDARKRVDELQAMHKDLTAKLTAERESHMELKNALLSKNAECLDWYDKYLDAFDEHDNMKYERDNLLDLLMDARDEYVELQAKMDEHRGTVHLDALSDANLGETVAHLRIDKLVEQRDVARARTDELSDELLRTRRERDEARDECDRLKRDMLDEWVPRTSYEEKVEKYRRAYMESDAWRKSLQEKLNAMRDAITAALNG